MDTSKGSLSERLTKGEHSVQNYSEDRNLVMSGNDPSSQAKQPLLDEYNSKPVAFNRGVYWVMVLMGAGQLYPYQTIITAADYFDVVFPNKKVTYWNTTILMYPATMLALIFIKYGHKLSFSIRIIGSCLIMGLVLAFIPMLAPLAGSSGLLAVLVAVGVTGALMCMTYSGIYAFAGLLPEIYTQSMMTGQAIAGVTVSTTRILTKYFFPNSDEGVEAGGRVFFYCGALWLLMCAIGFAVSLQSSFTKHYLKKYHDSQQALLISQNDLLDTKPESPAVGNSPPGFSSRKYQKCNVQGDVSQDQFDTPKKPKVWDLIRIPRLSNGSAKRKKPRTSYRKINHKIYKLGVCAVLVFVATFLPFPGLMVTLESEYECLSDGWFAIVLITEFTVFDTIGRYAAGYTKCGLTKDRLWFPVFLRFLLYPIFLLFYMRVYHNEILIFATNAVLAISNGFLVSIAMMLAPGQLLTHEREVGGAILSFYAQFGILAGCAGALCVSTILNKFGY